MKSFTLLACVASALPGKLSLCQPMSSLLPQPSHLRRMSERLCGAELLGGVKQ